MSSLITRTEDLLDWEYDIFNNYNIINPLTTMVLSIFKTYNLFIKLNLDINACKNFFTSIEKKYNKYPDLAYHTNLHAADVVHSVYNLLELKNIKERLSPLHIFCVITAAAVHDVAHFGKSNKYLTETNDPLAILYNYKSIMEHHHANIAFLTCKEKGCDIFESLIFKDKKECEELIIAIILNTDMSKHNELLDIELDLFKINIKNLLSLIVHLADLGNCSKPWHICEKWASLIMTELFLLGDKQLELGITVEYDRSKISLIQSQIRFIEIIVKPMWLKWDELLKYTSIQTLTIEKNLKEWYLKL